MVASYKKIDYRVRPAKSIERKMLAESFRRLMYFQDPSAYSYIGMGSLYFSDFNLFHRALGFRSMTSIEDCSNITEQARFKMNVPFAQIRMEFGRAGAVLQKLGDWKDSPAIIWLDYDGKLSEECLRDLEYVCANAASGTVLLASVNAEKLTLINRVDDDGNEIDERQLKPLEILSRNIDSGRVPLGIQNKDLSGWGVAATYREIVTAAMSKGVSLHALSDFRYEQIYNFTYDDGAKMLTVGGVLFSENDRQKFVGAGFESMEFVRRDKEDYRIDPPKLTYVEMRAINSDASPLPIPPGDVTKYKRTYRYFPHFIEAEVG